ncbi:hypothetical protein GCM10009118_27270 [Wandonia haliotis]|uniref:Polysaccharide biosynthesis protein n=1 Tax=Wandonia haliotis TaxID=574963 RepID=A0ABP3Y9K3_9FLAO
MGIIKKQSTYSLIILYAGVIIGFIGTALIRPKILSEGEIGLLQIILNTTAMFSGIFTLGANFTTLRMFPIFQSEKDNNRGLFSLVLLIGIMGALIMIPVFLATEFFFFENKEGESLEEFAYTNNFYLGVILVIIARLFQNILDGYLRANKVSTLGIFSDSIILKVFPIIGLALYYFEWIDFVGLIYFNMSIFILPLVLSFVFLKKLKIFHLSAPGPFSKEERKEMRGVSMVGLFEIISAGIILYVDTIMLQWLIGEEAVGVYSTLFFFGLVVGIPARGLTRVAIVIIAEAFAKKEMSEIQAIYKKSSEVLMVVAGYVFLMIWGNRYSVEQYLGEPFSGAIWVIFFIGLAQFTDVIASVNYQIIAVSRYYYFNVILSVISVVLLVLTDYWFITEIGIVGAALGSLVSVFVINLVRFIFLKSRYGLSPFSLKTLKSMSVFLGVLALSGFLPDLENLYLNLFWKGGIITLSFIPLVYVLKCSEDVNTVINNVFRKVFRVISGN